MDDNVLQYLRSDDNNAFGTPAISSEWSSSEDESSLVWLTVGATASVRLRKVVQLWQMKLGIITLVRTNSPTAPKRLKTMHVTEKLYVHAKLAIPCVLRLHANVRSTISWHAAKDFSVFTWQTVCQRDSHVKDGLEFRVIQSY